MNAFQWRYADTSSLIHKQWQEDHEKTAFASVYHFMFSNNAAAADSASASDPAAEITDECPNGNAIATRKEKKEEGVVVDKSALRVVHLNEKSCQQGRIVVVTVKEKTPPQIDSTTFVNEDADLQGYVIVDREGEEEDGNVQDAEERKLFISEETEEEELKALTEKTIDLERRNHVQSIKCTADADEKQEGEKESKVQENIKAPEALRLVSSAAEKETEEEEEIAISSEDLPVKLHDDQQPAEQQIVAEERRTVINSRNPSNKVIIPVIELRIDEEEEEELDQAVDSARAAAPLPLMEDIIKPVGAAADDRGGGLIVGGAGKSVDAECEIDAEIAICNDDRNNNNVIRGRSLQEEQQDAEEEEVDDDASKRLLINEIATKADVHPVPPQIVITEGDNHQAAHGGGLTLIVDRGVEEDEEVEPSKESTISHHHKVEGNEAKVIVAEGERESHGAGDSVGKSTNFTKVGEKQENDCDKNQTANKPLPPDSPTKDDSDIAMPLPPSNVGKRMESGGRVGGGGERKNVNVQIRRKQYDVISSLDDYITSSSSVDDLDTVSSSCDDYGSRVGVTSDLESGSERLSALEVDSTSTEDVAESWIKELMDEQKRRRGGRGGEVVS